MLPVLPDMTFTPLTEPIPDVFLLALDVGVSCDGVLESDLDLEFVTSGVLGGGSTFRDNLKS